MLQYPTPETNPVFNRAAALLALPLLTKTHLPHRRPRANGISAQTQRAAHGKQTCLMEAGNIREAGG